MELERVRGRQATTTLRRDDWWSDGRNLWVQKRPESDDRKCKRNSRSENDRDQKQIRKEPRQRDRQTADSMNDKWKNILWFRRMRRQTMLIWSRLWRLRVNEISFAWSDLMTDDFSESDSEDGRSNNLSMNSSASDCVSLTSSVVTDSSNAAQPSPPSPGRHTYLHFILSQNSSFSNSC